MAEADEVERAAYKHAVARIAELEAAIRTARALADHVIHGETSLASIEDVHKVLSDALKIK